MNGSTGTCDKRINIVAQAHHCSFIYSTFDVIGDPTFPFLALMSQRCLVLTRSVQHDQQKPKLKMLAERTATRMATAVEEVDGNKPLLRQLKQKCKL